MRQHDLLTNRLCRRIMAESYFATRRGKGMAQNELTKACYELSVSIIRLCGGNPASSALINELLRAAGALGQRARAAGFESSKTASSQVWQDTYRACIDAESWLTLCAEAGVLSDKERLPLQRRCALLKGKLADTCRSVKEKNERRFFEKAGTIRFQSKRLVFRGWTASDISLLQGLCADEDYRRSGLPLYETRDEAIAAIRHWQNGDDAFVICHHKNNIPIGYAALLNDGDGKRRYRLLLAIAAEYRHRGYAAEALGSLLDDGFQRTEVTVIAARLPLDSLFESCLHRFGFASEGVLRGHGKNGEDILSLSLTKDTWLKANSDL